MVGQVIEKHSLSPHERRAWSTVCRLSGNRHGTQVSYGKNNLGNMMRIYMTVRFLEHMTINSCADAAVQCGMGCADHMKPLPKQTSSWKKYMCFQELLKLAALPACYTLPQFQDFCRREADRCLEDLSRPEADNHTSTPSRSRPTRSVPVTPSRAAHQLNNVKRTPGRPPLPRVEHPLYAFYRDGASPLALEVSCIIDGEGLARFRYDLPEVRAALMKVLGPNALKRKFDVWVHTQEDWRAAPKASEEQLLLPGEGRVYRLREVSDMPDLERYKFLALPRADRLAIDPNFMAPIPYTIPDDDGLSSSERDSSPAPEPPSSSLPSTPIRASSSQVTPGLGKRPADNSEALASKKRRLACQRVAAVLGMPESDDRVANASGQLSNGTGKGKAKETAVSDWHAIDECALTDAEVSSLFLSM